MPSIRTYDICPIFFVSILSPLKSFHLRMYLLHLEAVKNEPLPVSTREGCHGPGGLCQCRQPPGALTGGKSWPLSHCSGLGGTPLSSPKSPQGGTVSTVSPPAANRCFGKSAVQYLTQQAVHLDIDMPWESKGKSPKRTARSCINLRSPTCHCFVTLAFF